MTYVLKFVHIMSSIHNIDLNLPPEEDSFANCHAQHPSTHANEENSNHGHSHDINAGNISSHIFFGV